MVDENRLGTHVSVDIGMFSSTQRRSSSYEQTRMDNYSYKSWISIHHSKTELCIIVQYVFVQSCCCYRSPTSSCVYRRQSAPIENSSVLLCHLFVIKNYWQSTVLYVQYVQLSSVRKFWELRISWLGFEWPVNALARPASPIRFLPPAKTCQNLCHCKTMMFNNFGYPD